MLEAAMLEAAWLNASHGSFVFRGFPSLQQQQRRLLAAFFSASFAAALLGNGALAAVILRAPSLRRPMFLLVSSLCVVDVLAVTTVVPTALLGLLGDGAAISLEACLTQMFLTHFLSSLESTLLLAMALDRYVAVCHPLRYARLATDAAILAKLLLLAALRSGATIATLVAMAASLRFCGSNVIRHCYCDHMAVVSLACGDTAGSGAAGLAVIACVVGVDIPVIFFSYARILTEVTKKNTKKKKKKKEKEKEEKKEEKKMAAAAAAGNGEDRWKAFHTCGTHLMVMMCFYLVGSVTFLAHNVKLGLPTDVHSVLGLAYILLPAAVNPLIYGARTKHIRRAFTAMVTHTNTH